MYKYFENKNQKLLRFNKHYGAVVRLRPVKNDKEASVQLVKLDVFGSQKIYEPIESIRVCKEDGIKEADEVLIYLDTLCNTLRLKQAIECLPKISYEDIKEFNKNNPQVQYKGEKSWAH